MEGARSAWNDGTLGCCTSAWARRTSGATAGVTTSISIPPTRPTAGWRRPAGVQQEEQYRGKTTLLLTTDHGRGLDARGLDRSRPQHPGAHRCGLRRLARIRRPWVSAKKIEVTQSQVAATIARLLGEDFNAASKDAAKPLPVFGE